MSGCLPSALWLDLLGKPFREGARGPDAFDCVGLLIEMQRRLGRVVPDWSSDPLVLASALARWERVRVPDPGDGVLIYSVNPQWHVGVVSGGGCMLHAHPDRGVARERIDAFPWHKRIEGFYRWKPA
jgi:cell wall-associated NlpC family hydrolase